MQIEETKDFSLYNILNKFFIRILYCLPENLSTNEQKKFPAKIVAISQNWRSPKNNQLGIRRYSYSSKFCCFCLQQLIYFIYRQTHAKMNIEHTTTPKNDNIFFNERNANRNNLIFSK